MNTSRVCAVLGLGFACSLGSGCHSSSSSGPNDAGRDTRGNRDVPSGTSTNTSTNTSTATACTYNGTTYQPGQSFTVNCVTFTCVSGTNFTSRGSPCTDAAPPDLRPGPDMAAGPDVAASPDVRSGDTVPPGDTGGAQEVAVSEAGKEDTSPPLDGGQPDLALPEDVAPPPPDVTSTPDELAGCLHGGDFYSPGDEYYPDSCNTCVCLASGDFACTNKVCEVDAGEGID
jgi:hypothetical protein